jgi:hypothetical protein
MNLHTLRWAVRVALVLGVTASMAANVPHARANPVSEVIAGWVSSWHMVGVAARHGDIGISPYLLPLSVDGLIVVASISLVELTARIRAHETELASVHSGPSTWDEEPHTARPVVPLPPLPLNRPNLTNLRRGAICAFGQQDTDCSSAYGGRTNSTSSGCDAPNRRKFARARVRLRSRFMVPRTTSASWSLWPSSCQ